MQIFTSFVCSIHFIGVGGIGMSGLAEILHNKGYSVTGSDIAENSNVVRLRKLGVAISIGHSEENIDKAQVVVVSTAIPTTNPELKAARLKKIPIITRGGLLAEMVRMKRSIAISGTHGKTTTTSIIGSLLEEAGQEPTIINGGIINSIKTNAKLGNGEWIVVEADESDGSFLKLNSTINVITNIEPEHMEYYGNEENLEKSFVQFINNAPFYGLGIVCLDDPGVRKVFKSDKYNIDRLICTYGVCNDADLRIFNMQNVENGTLFSLEWRQNKNFMNYNKHNTSLCSAQIFDDIFIPLFGMHNVLNATAAIAVALEVGVELNIIKDALKKFGGVNRRFTIVGKKKDVVFVDDYAHHPTEIKCVIDVAKQVSKNKTIVIFQPHRYSRFSMFWESFAEVLTRADSVIVLPVYAASESEKPGIDNKSFVNFLKKRGYSEGYVACNEAETLKLLEKLAKPESFLVGVGAGSISGFMYRLMEKY